MKPTITIALAVAGVVAAAAAAFQPFSSLTGARQGARSVITRNAQPESSPMGHPASAEPKRVISKSAHDVTRLSDSRIAELASSLTAEEARVILRRGTEPAFCGNLTDNKRQGVYLCRLCGLPLFSSGHKFDSGSGWPSFFRPIDAAHVGYLDDSSHGMRRTEIVCTRCGGHLGHVFDDAPSTPTGARYCLNSVSLEFVDDGSPVPDRSRPIPTETAYFAGGCFWGVEDRFEQVPGVIDAVSGYMGGRVESPGYKQVCSGTTGHAETVRVVFDPSAVSYADLLARFFTFHDPTQVDRQGPDVGTQYRSAIFAASPSQADQAARFVADEQATNPRFKSRRIATQVVGPDRAGVFYEAEAYHQDYHLRNGGHCPLPEDP